MVNIADNENKNLIMEQAKQTAKKVVKRIITFKVILALILIVAIIVLLSAIIWFFFKDSGVWGKEEKGRPNIYTDNVKMDPKEGIVIDKEAVIKQALLDMGFTEDEIAEMSEQEIISRFSLSQKLNRTITSLDECTATEILWCLSEEYSNFLDSPEQLEFLLKAELITQYPYIDGLDDSKTNGVIKFYRYSNTGEVDFKSSYANAGENNKEEEQQQEEESEEEPEIDASKIFYIGDSWMNRLKLYNYISADYTYAKDGVSASSTNWANGIKSSVKSDSSAIVIMLGLNNTGSAEQMKKLLGDLTSLNKPIYVLRVFYVAKGYGNAEQMNRNIDTYNKAISEYCASTENVNFIDTTTGLYDGNYLSGKYSDSTYYHLNKDGCQQWYYNIEQALKAGGGLRTNINNQEAYRIKYTSRENFDALYSEYESSGNRDIFKYFTLDDEGNVEVATWTKTTGNFTTQNGIKSIGEIQSTYDPRYQQTSSGVSFVEYRASITKINYKSMASKYTIPFEYLWALLVEGEDYKFVERVANLAYNTEFCVGIYDSVNTSTNVDKRYYTRVITKTTTRTNSAGETSSKTTTSTVPCVDISTITTETDTISYDVAYANTWIVEIWTKYIAKNFSGDSNKDVTIMEGQKGNLSEGELKDRLENFEENEDKEELKNATEGEEILINTPTVNEVENTEISQAENLTVTEQTSVNNSYERTTPELREKIDIDPNTGDNFVKALRESENAYRLLTNNGTLNWLCEILEENEDTANMVDLTKALIKKAIDPDAEIDFDFSIFKPDSFSDFGAIYGNSLEEKVWFALKGMGYSDEAAAGAMGNFYCESGFKSNNLENSYEKKLGYTDESYTEAVDNGSYSLQRFISDHDEANCGAGYGLAQWTFYSRKEALYNFAKSKGTSIGDEDMQLEFLLNNIRDTQNTSAHDKWKSSATPEEAATNFCAYYERGTGDSARRSAARMMYEKWKGAEKSSEQAFQVSATDKYMGAVITTDKRVSAIYGNDGYHDHYHRGIDIAAPGGTPIVALGSGKVVDARFNPARGYFVRIDHGNGYCTLYQHCSKIASNISVGTTVKKGQVIAYVGSTGKSSGNHLHLEVWVPHGQGYDNWGNKTWDVTDPSKFNYSLLPD